MNYVQVYNIVNAANRQMWGADAISVNNLAGLISLGDLVYKSDENKDGFLGTLVDRINQTLFRTLDNRVQFPSFIRNEIEYGAILQKVNIDVMPAQSAQWARIGENDFTPNQFKIDKPIVKVMYFGDPRLCWEFDLTVPDTLYKTAFTSESKMAAFISGLMRAMDKSLTESINSMNHAALCNLIAEKFKRNHNIVHVVTEFNLETGGNVTSANCRYNEAFNRYFSMRLDNYIQYMAESSVLYNEGIGGEDQLRATQRDNMHCLISADVAGAMKFNLYNDFNYDFVKLPMYDEYVSLQGSGTTAHNYVDDTTINVIPSSEKDEETPTAVNESYIAAVLCDREAIFTTWRDMFTATDRNNRNRYTNFTAGCGLAWGNDLSENCVIFQFD